MINENIISQAQAARLLGVSRAYVNQLVTIGRLTSVEIAGRKFVVQDQKFNNLKK